MIPTTLVVGASTFEREQLIANRLAALPVTMKSAVILEGLADGKTLLVADEHVLIARIASGCLCCSNQMIMRVYLNRMIVQKPQQLLLSLSNSEHLDQIKLFFSSLEYEQLLTLVEVIDLNLTIQD